MQHRAKDPTSLGRKAAIPSETDPARPKYEQPIKQITDLAGIRIITQVLGTVPEINKSLHSEFDVLEQSDKRRELIEKEQFGYQSIHYLVRVSLPDRPRITRLPILGLRDEFVATRPDQLQTARRLPQQQLSPATFCSAGQVGIV